MRRRARRRRRIIVGTVAVLAVAGAGTAWATRGSSGPDYRLASATRADVSETVDADGTLSADDRATLAFASAGTVESVAVRAGGRVTAGQTVASLDATALRAAVTDAQASVARAQQQLSDDESAQATGTTTSSAVTSTGSSTGTAGFVQLTALHITVAPSGGLARAQAAVVRAQQQLDRAVGAQDHAVSALVTACAASDETTPETTSVTAGPDGTVSGTAGAAPLVVTLRDAAGDVATTTSANPQRVTAGGSWTFAGLPAGTAFTVATTRTGVISSDACVAAVSDVQDAQRGVDSASGGLDSALSDLDRAIQQQGTGSTGGGTKTGSGSGTKSGTGSGGATRTGTGAQPGSSQSGSSRSGSSQSGSSSQAQGQQATTRTITAEQIAADAKAIDAANAQVAVARADVTGAQLTTPISGTVAGVAITKGQTVGASSSSAVITVVGTGALTVEVPVGLADIDKVKVGQHASVSVDGHTAPYAATVSRVGVLNSASSTGSSSSYPVTVQLDQVQPALYDGMGAGVAIAVGTARGVVTVPLSAVATLGTRHTVTVVAGGKATTTPVTLGLTGADDVQVTAGLEAGQRVVIADVGAAVPTSGTTNRRGTGFGGLTGGGAGLGGGGLGGGARGGFGGGGGRFNR